MTKRLRRFVVGVALLLAAVGLWHLRTRSPTQADATSAESSRPAPGFLARVLGTGARSRETSLRGLVVDTAGNPVPNAQVLVFDVESDPLPACEPRRGRFAPDGRCTWEDAPGPLLAWMRSHREDTARASTTTDTSGQFELPRARAVEQRVWASRGAAVGFATSTRGDEEVRVVIAQGVAIHGQVRDDAGRGIAGAAVSAIHTASRRIFEVLTDPNGHYQTEALPPGDYEVLATAAGRSAAVQDAPQLASDLELDFTLGKPRGLSGWVTRDGAPVPHATVTLEGSEERTARTDGAGTFHFEELLGGRYVVSCVDGDDVATESVWLIGGRERRQVGLELQRGGRIEGDVVGPDGVPIAAKIQAERRRRAPKSAQATAQGRFVLRAMEAGKWTVTASAAGFAASSSVSVHAIPGEVAQVHLTLLPSAAISGRVVDGAGAPLAGVVVTAQVQRGAVELHATSDAEGAFRLDGIAAGEVVLRARRDGSLPWQRTVRAPAEGLEVRLERGGAVSGTVLDAKGEPLAGVPVWAQAAGSKRAAPLQTTRTDRAGAFQLSGLADGEYRVVASRSDPGSEELRMTSAEASLQHGSAPPLTLRFEEGGPLQGVVVDGHGQGIAGVTVWVGGPEGELGPEVRSARTDSDGRFELLHLREGELQVFAQKEGYRAGLPLTAHTGDRSVKIVLAAARRIRGRVLDDKGAPIPRFSVGSEDVADPTGAFDLPVPGRSDSRTQVSVRAPGFAPLRVDVTLSEDVTDLGELRLDAGRSVEGRVVDARSGAPVAGALISAGATEGWFRARVSSSPTTSDADGRFTLQHLSADPQSITATRSGYAERTLSLEELESSGTLTLNPEASLHGKVFDTNGAPARAFIVASRTGGRAGGAQTKEDGSFELTGLVPGTYVLQTSAEDRDLHFEPRTVELAEGAAVEVELRPWVGGATLHVQLAGKAPGSVSFFLAQGALNLSTPTMTDLLTVMSAGIRPATHDGDSAIFQNVRAGPFTLVAIARGQDGMVLSAAPIEASGEEQRVTIPVPSVPVPRGE